MGGETPDGGTKILVQLRIVTEVRIYPGSVLINLHKWKKFQFSLKTTT